MVSMNLANVETDCDMVCHKKCEKLTGNLCGLNQKLVAEALQSLKRGEWKARVGNSSGIGIALLVRLL